MPASTGFIASPADKSNPTASSRAVLSSNNLTIVSCGSNPLLTAENKREQTDVNNYNISIHKIRD